MYFPYFITYIAVGLIVTIAVFTWAVWSGQFKDQHRARFLPLEEEGDPVTAGRSRFSRWEVYTLMALALAGLGASGAVLLFSLTAG